MIQCIQCSDGLQYLSTIFTSSVPEYFCDTISRMAIIRKATADFGKITEFSIMFPETIKIKEIEMFQELHI